MRRVLVISPHFPPVNAPDHQRVRMALPYLRELGWEATVLAVDPDEIDGLPREPLLEQTIPTDVEVIRCGAAPLALVGRLGMRTLGLRAYPYVARAGSRLLRGQRFDLVFFSTTQFTVMALGPQWLERFGVPYVLDFQDPWLGDDYRERDASTLPGGKWKYGFSQWIAGRLEPRAVRDCAHAICVSPAYPEFLHRRYPHVETSRFSVLPFAVDEGDFVIARLPEARQSIFDPRDGHQHWVYVGVAPPNFATALRGFFRALARAIADDPQVRDRIIIHFVGTSYASGDRAQKTVEPIANEFGVAGCITEHPLRIPYFQALRCLLDADALILPGSDDPTYTASKLMPCLFARKPLLAIFHEGSPVVQTLRDLGAGTVVGFRSETSATELGTRVWEEWFEKEPRVSPIVSHDLLVPFTARSMSVKLVEIFERTAAAHKMPLAGTVV